MEMGTATKFRFHIIGIVCRRFPGDRAYTVRESFDAASFEEAHSRHVAFAKAHRVSNVLRDGRTGERYSVEQSHRLAKVAA